MSENTKPPIFAYCPAGCKWETVHKEDLGGLELTESEVNKLNVLINAVSGNENYIRLGTNTQALNLFSSANHLIFNTKNLAFERELVFEGAVNAPQTISNVSSGLYIIEAFDTVNSQSTGLIFIDTDLVGGSTYTFYGTMGRAIGPGALHNNAIFFCNCTSSGSEVSAEFVVQSFNDSTTQDHVITKIWRIS